MSNTEYGTVNTQDEEAPLLHTQVEQSRWEFIKEKLHLHGHRVLISWIIVLSVTAVLTLSFHFALKEHHPPVEGDDLLIQCVSDRSWFVALLLSIFVGPFGVDRFYLGYVFWGIIKLLTGGVFGILYVVDIILIALNVLPDHFGCILH
ncbi:uncharacterized protein BX664DRAFT_339038 [Halteromyces radiatus]|uniref:uncharacterized protein n=1 Tax=Halteromyces radiatus TaxID=101107 RepID=UPI00221ED17B|nr:uncharacterized protein BX664DRAFT_339038 [Halteromyces radiatus]KAI8082775.1 hypothetical protein BX664DRAFT_339038 [Halteromyces radiatus]